MFGILIPCPRISPLLNLFHLLSLPLPTFPFLSLPLSLPTHTLGLLWLNRSPGSSVTSHSWPCLFAPGLPLTLSCPQNKQSSWQALHGNFPEILAESIHMTLSPALLNYSRIYLVFAGKSFSVTFFFFNFLHHFFKYVLGIETETSICLCARLFPRGKMPSSCFSHTSLSENKISRWEEKLASRVNIEGGTEKKFSKEKTWELTSVFPEEGSYSRRPISTAHF